MTSLVSRLSGLLLRSLGSFKIEVLFENHGLFLYFSIRLQQLAEIQSFIDPEVLEPCIRKHARRTENPTAQPMSAHQRSNRLTWPVNTTGKVEAPQRSAEDDMAGTANWPQPHTRAANQKGRTSIKKRWPWEGHPHAQEGAAAKRSQAPTSTIMLRDDLLISL